MTQEEFVYVICDIYKNNPFSSLALTNVTPFIGVKPQVPAPQECDWTITFQVFTSLPKYFLCPLDPVDKLKGYRKRCVYFTKYQAFSTDHRPRGIRRRVRPKSKVEERHAEAKELLSRSEAACVSHCPPSQEETWR